MFGKDFYIYQINSENLIIYDFRQATLLSSFMKWKKKKLSVLYKVDIKIIHE